MRPEAAPGPAGRPLAMTLAALIAARSKTGASTWSNCSAGTRCTASSQVINFSRLHFDGETDGGQAGAFAVAGLEHEQFAVFNGELKILHIAEMLFQNFADLGQFGGGFGQDSCPVRPPVWECGRRPRRPRPGRS